MKKLILLIALSFIATQGYCELTESQKDKMRNIIASGSFCLSANTQCFCSPISAEILKMTAEDDSMAIKIITETSSCKIAELTRQKEILESQISALEAQ